MQLRTAVTAGRTAWRMWQSDDDTETLLAVVLGLAVAYAVFRARQ
jgi:hypothetical protein